MGSKEPVAIMLDKERHLIYDMNAMADFEEVTGKNIFDLEETDFTMRDMRALMWACLRQEDESLTIKDVGRLITAADFNDVTERLSAVKADAEKSKGAGKGNAKKERQTP